MKRFLILLAVLAVAFGCSKKDQDTASTKEEATTAQAESGEPRQAIPDKEQAITGTPTLKPYFDEMGTLTEKTVSPGESFDLFIIVGCGENDRLTAAEYKLNIPDGITITREFDSDSLTMKSGKLTEDMMVAFKCSSGPRIFLARYVFLVGDNFTGGTISTDMGETSRFIGVVDCGPAPEKISAEKGTAVLKIK